MKQRFVKIFSVRGVPVYLHWTLVVLLAVFLIFGWDDRETTLTVLCIFFILFVHEAGHMLMAARYHVRVTRIDLYPLMGLTIMEGWLTQMAHVAVSWGGVLAQCMLLVAALIIQRWEAAFIPLEYRFIPEIFIRFNALMMVLNLLPLPGFDGATAWQIFRLKLPKRTESPGLAVKPKKRKSTANLRLIADTHQEKKNKKYDIN